MGIPTFEELFKVIEFNKWLLGISDKKIYLRFYVIYLIYFPILLEEGGYFVTKTSSENFVTLAGLAPCICYCTLSIIKIQAFILNKSKIVIAVNNIRELYSKILKDPRKTAIVQREIIFVQKLTKYLYLLNFMLVCVYNFSSLVIIPYYYITQNRIVYDLPYPVIVPFSTEAWIPWFIVYIHSTSCGYICIIYVVTVDCLYFILVTNVCINFSILSNDIEHLDDNNYRNIHHCIRTHQYLIKLSDDLDEIFALPNFFNVLFGAIQICALGFCITAGEWSNVPGYLLFLSTVMAQIWTMSIFGENIMSRSGKVNDAIANCNWYETDAKTMKTIMFIIARSQKPQRLTAYIFSTVCMASFTKILSNSWSYFSILRSAYKAPDVNKQ